MYILPPIGLGNKLAGTIGQNFERLGEKTILGITFICLLTGLIVILFHKKLNNLSHGIDD